MFLAGPLAHAQRIDYTIGARAGFVLNRPVRDRSAFTQQGTSIFRNDTQSFTAGPSFEIGFKQRFGLELSPTWRREGATSFYESNSSAIPTLPPGGLALVSQFTRESGHSWDIPLVGKYYFARKDAKIRPFLGLGASATRHSGATFVHSQLLTDAGSKTYQLFDYASARWSFGPVVAGGVAIRSGRISIVPECRYVRDNLAYPGPRNRAEAFLGFRF